MPSKKRANETDRLRMILVNGQNVFLRIQTKPSTKTILKALLHEFREGMKLMSKRNFSGEKKTKD